MHAINKHVTAQHMNRSTSAQRQPEEAAQIERFTRSLHQAMVASGSSQRGLSQEIGVTIGTMTKYLRGEVAPLRVGLGIQQRLAGVLGVTLDALCHYYETGEYATEIRLDDVVSWIRSEAGQEAMPQLMGSLHDAGQRWLQGGGAGAPAAVVAQPEPFTWPLEELQRAGVSDRLRERMGLGDETLKALALHGEWDEELVEAFSVAADLDPAEVRKAFQSRKPIPPA